MQERCKYPLYNYVWNAHCHSARTHPRFAMYFFPTRHTMGFVAVVIMTAISMASALRIDTEFRTTPGVWDETYHGGIWSRVVTRMQNLATVAEMDSFPSTPPPGGYCGPRYNDVISDRHVNGDSLVMQTMDTMIVYMYTDTAGTQCAPPNPPPGYAPAIAVSYVCKYNNQNGRPVLGYINICRPNHPTMYTTMAHELVHLMGFHENVFQSSFPDFDRFNIVGRLGSTVSFIRKHFGCNDLEGVPIIAERSHLDGFFAGDELMTPCGGTVEHRLTELTAHVLADLGWYGNDGRGYIVFKPYYRIDFTYADPFLYGYSTGCNYLPLKCTELGTLNSSLVSPLSMEEDVRCATLCKRPTPDFVVPMTLKGAIAMADPYIMEHFVLSEEDSSKLEAAFTGSVISLFLLLCGAVGVCVGIASLYYNTFFPETSYRPGDKTPKGGGGGGQSKVPSEPSDGGDL